jgi:polyisoprenoid-binding protein YceI
VTGTLTADAQSITTKYDRLTMHLLSADFFDVVNHPTIDFVAHCVFPDGPDRATVNGQLNILGKTQHISFPYERDLNTPTRLPSPAAPKSTATTTA